ncbi:hypothetical protein T439DRAFT_379283 [Meredithblackwellia eburnea MCA 4105]
MTNHDPQPSSSSAATASSRHHHHHHQQQQPTLTRPSRAHIVDHNSKPFHLADIARAAIARPRQLDPWATTTSNNNNSLSNSEFKEWADRDPQLFPSDNDDDDDLGLSSPASTAFTTPSNSTPSSCAITPSSSSEGFPSPQSNISSFSHFPPSPIPSSPTTTSTSCPSPSSSGRPLPTPESFDFSHSHIHQQKRPAKSTPPPTPPKPQTWSNESFSLKLFFTNNNLNPPSGDDDDPVSSGGNNPFSEHHLPPAFFPSQRISFTPRLRVIAPEGLPYSAIGGMHLGVTGMCETLDPNGNILSKRMIADFTTNLGTGINMWKRDGLDAARKLALDKSVRDGERAGRADFVDESDLRLPPGTYKLPLTMKIPDSERLPPSFECSQFRIHYTMSVAIFSTATTSDGTPQRLKVFSVPFHILPSTLPTPAPELPILTHDHKKSVFSSLLKSFSFGSSSSSSSPRSDSGFHIVFPSLPTSHYSPGSHASIPVTLRVVDRPLEPTDLYFRLALVRRTYVRESSHTSLATAIDDEWGLGMGVTPQALGYSEDVLLEPWCKEEVEIVSRWGWVPYASRPGANPHEKAEVVIQDIALPLSGPDGQGWSHGYSTCLDIEPVSVPSQTHGTCSWFSPAFRSRAPVAKEYARHVHLSARFYLSVQVGFANPSLGEVLKAVGSISPDMEIARPNNFTQPRAPGVSAFSGASLVNPFAAAASSSRGGGGGGGGGGGRNSSSNSSSSTSPFNNPPSFPGKLRELFIPLTIGSVAEPSLDCIARAGDTESAAQRREREMREERGEDVRSLGEGPEGAWLCAPPRYEDALRSVPAYVFAQA